MFEQHHTRQKSESDMLSFDYLSLDELNDDRYKNFMDEKQRKAIIKSLLQVRIKQLTNGSHTKSGA